jgi:adenylate cyclase
MSERYEAAQVVTILNRYFTIMNKIIIKHGGIIDKYMGDAIMALFGLPQQTADDTHLAIICAIKMQVAMDKINDENRAEGLPDLFMGIGINTGIVSAGQLGSQLHNEYTVIGDHVNLASRIESHSARGQILISDFTYQQVKDGIEIGTVNKVRLKGKSEMIPLYEVTGIHWRHHNIGVPRREIRNNVRVDINAKFPFQIIEHKEILPDVYTAQAKDISYNGIFAVLEQPIEVLTDIKLSLSLSLLGNETRDIYGKIMSVRAIEGGYGCGIEFTALDKDSEGAIKDFIDRIIESS